VANSEQRPMDAWRTRWTNAVSERFLGLCTERFVLNSKYAIFSLNRLSTKPSKSFAGLNRFLFLHSHPARMQPAAGFFYLHVLVAHFTQQEHTMPFIFSNQGIRS
jgi:hypothetical protein